MVFISLGCGVCNVLVACVLVCRWVLRFLGVSVVLVYFSCFFGFLCVMLVIVFWLVFAGFMFLDGTNSFFMTFFTVFSVP